MDEMISEKFLVASRDDTVNNNEQSYENEARLNRKNKEEVKMEMPDEDKDIDEKKGLLDLRPTAQNNYINT